MSERKESASTPETELNKVLLDTLGSLDKTLVQKGKSPLRCENDGVRLVSEGKTLAKIAPDALLIGGEDFQSEVTSPSPVPSFSPFDQRFTGFLDRISADLVRVNHLGISYFCDDISSETERLKVLAEKGGVNLYQEASSEGTQKWLFLGDTSNWQEPLFELVLNKNVSSAESKLWVPHFQIDIDTTLSDDEIKAITDEELGDGFAAWNLDIPNVGTVLTMGVLGEVNGTKIVLGIGTNKRNPEYHRRVELKPL